tara:strand:+ start:1127 stop:1483 length:357 start_codon:yes stop_codon:yes gene_type:complete
MWIVSNEDKVVASTWGATVRLTANEPKQVGDELGLLCLQAGCTEVKGGVPDVKVEEVPEPVVEEQVSVEEAAVVEEPKPNLKGMSKIELEEYGRTLGIELDRRKKKAALIAEIEDCLH